MVKENVTLLLFSFVDSLCLFILRSGFYSSLIVVSSFFVVFVINLIIYLF